MNNRLSLEVLHARRPTLNYISPPICEANFSGSGFAVVILDAFGGLSPITGLRVEFDSSGRFRIRWDVYPDALCYNVYRANDPGNPTGIYTLVASCIPTPEYSTADCPACFLITAVTLRGETPFAGPICTDCPAPPPGPVVTYFSAAYTASCPSGFSGSPVTIPAGAYTSLISQANADAKAQDAAEAALVCTPCSLPAGYYSTFGTSFDGFDPGPAPPGTFGNAYGQIIVFNNTDDLIDRITITVTQGSSSTPTLLYDANPGNMPANTYKSFGWIQWNSATNPVFWPRTNFHVVVHTIEPLTGDPVATIDAGTQTFTTHEQTLTWWVGETPPC